MLIVLFWEIFFGQSKIIKELWLYFIVIYNTQKKEYSNKVFNTVEIVVKLICEINPVGMFK